MRKSAKKTAIVMLTMAALVMSTVGEAQARIGSRPASASSPRPAVTGFKLRSTSDAASSGRLGGGSSMGMQRSGVMNTVRSQPAPAPAPSYAPSYRQAPAPAPVAPAPSPSQANSGKRSWVAPAVAGVAAGALAGYALGHSNSHDQAPAPQYQQPAPQYQSGPAYQQAPAEAPAYSQAAPAPAYNQAAPAYNQAAPSYASGSHSSGGFGFGSFLLLILLAGAAIFGYRRYVASKGDIKADARRTGTAAHAAADAFKSAMHTPAAASAPTAAPASSTMSTAQAEQDLQAIAKQFYLELQILNNQGDLVTLRNRVGDDGLYEELAKDIRTRTQASQTEVISVYATVVDITDEGNRFVGSVRYQGECKEAPYSAAESFDEVFHFIKDKAVTGDWKLAGIEQVEEA